MMIRKNSAVRRKKFIGIILSLVIGICVITQPMSAFAVVLSSTVDNSVDKSSTQVLASLQLTRSCSDDDDEILVYDSLPVKVDYRNPQNDYIESLMDDANNKLLRLAEALVETHPDDVEVGEVFVDKHEESYDNRIYTWVNDDDSEGGIIIDDGSTIGVGNQNRHMVIEGDYARTTVIVLELNIHYNSHEWDEGVVTKEASKTEEGLLTYTCKYCEETKTETIPVLDLEQTVIEKPVYNGDIVADGMIHQITEFYDFSGLPEGTVVYREIDEETSITLDVHGDLSPLELRLPVETSFSLVLPSGYVFAGEEELDSMECLVRIIEAAENQEPTTEPQPEEYYFIDGQNGVWEQNSSEKLTFRANGDINKFTGVKVDGALIDEKNYSAVSGSTIVTLENDYLKTLVIGNHSMAVIFTDGECITNFEIKAAKNPAAPENNNENINTNDNGTQVPQQAVNGGGNVNKPVDSATPQTGDSSHMLLWTTFLFISCGAVAGIVMYGKKRKCITK